MKAQRASIAGQRSPSSPPLCPEALTTTVQASPVTPEVWRCALDLCHVIYGYGGEPCIARVSELPSRPVAGWKTHEAGERREAQPLVGSESHRSALSCLSLSRAARPSRGPQMGTAIYKLSGKISFQVKKTHRPGRLPLLLSPRHLGCWEGEEPPRWLVRLSLPLMC